MNTNNQVQVNRPIFASNITNIENVSSISTVKDDVLHQTSGRDIVILNPFCAGGGDAALANKIANVLLSQNCRVAIFPIAVNEKKVLPCTSLSVSKPAPDIKQFQKPLLIISPVQILEPEDALLYVQQLCETYNWEKNDIALIEEMDLLPFRDVNNEVEERVSHLKTLGFKSVQAHRLGFSENAIGYLPVDENSMSEIKNRFQAELAKLLDSYHFSLSLNSYYYIAYISSGLPVTNSQVFIANTLVKDHHENKDANYIILIRDFNAFYQKNMPGYIAEFLMQNSSEYQYISLYKKANIFIANEEHIDLIQQAEGTGSRQINILLTNSLPQNIYFDFLYLSRMAMVSGDQSLSEFLSIKEKVPYYEAQPWKAPLSNALKMHAENIGGEVLKKEISYQISELRPFTGEKKYAFRPHPAPTPTPENTKELEESLQEFNKLIISKRADSIIKALVTKPFD